MHREQIHRGRVILGTILAAGLVMSPPVMAGDDFQLHLDPLVLEVLETDVDTESSKFEEYRDLGSGFRIPRLKIEGVDSAGERHLSFLGERIGRQDARYQMSYGVAGHYKIRLDYRKIPHLFGNNGTFLWNNTGPGRLEIADPTQAFLQGEIEARRGNGAIDFDFLNSLIAPFVQSAQQVDIALRRDRTTAKIDFGTLGRFSWGLEYGHENRKGNRAYGGSFGFGNVTEILEPIDYDTTEVQLGGEWNGDKGGLQFGYRYSRFENQISTLIWDNPFRATDSTDGRAYLAPGGASIGGSSLGFADLAPDNESSQLYLSGRRRFGAWWTHGSASYAVMEQDDPLLPYTLNTSIVGIDPFTGATFDPTDPANLPTSHADTEVDVLTVNASAGRKFGDGWQLTFRGRYYDYDNQSSRIELPGYVRYHAVWEEIPRITVPYAYSRQEVGAELAKHFGQSSRLAVAYKLKTWDREFRETEESDEDIIRLTFDTRPHPKVKLNASYELTDRTVDNYDTEAQEFSFLLPEGANNQPGLRKYAQAARETDGLRLALQFFPHDAWNIDVGVSHMDEDYDESELGLIADEVMQLSAEVGYTPGENLTFFVFGHRSDRDTLQRSRQSGGTVSTNPDDNWQADFEEVTDTWGLGLRAQLSERSELDISGNWSRSDGLVDLFTTPAGSPSSAEDIDNYEDIELFALRARIDFEITDAARAGLSYRYEDFTLDRFILQGLLPYLPGATLLAADEGDYQASVIGVDLRLSF